MLGGWGAKELIRFILRFEFLDREGHSLRHSAKHELPVVSPFLLESAATRPRERVLLRTPVFI